MNDEQYKRFRKMNAETIECLFYTHDKNKSLHFLINGSQQKRYKVTIPKDGKITCSCPDFTHNSKVNECVCKHCLHIIYNILKLFSDVDHTFFTRLFFSKDEIQEIHKIYKKLGRKKLIKK